MFFAKKLARNTLFNIHWKDLYPGWVLIPRITSLFSKKKDLYTMYPGAYNWGSLRWYFMVRQQLNIYSQLLTAMQAATCHQQLVRGYKPNSKLHVYKVKPPASTCQSVDLGSQEQLMPVDLPSTARFTGMVDKLVLKSPTWRVIITVTY